MPLRRTRCLRPTELSVVAGSAELKPREAVFLRVGARKAGGRARMPSRALRVAAPELPGQRLRQRRAVAVSQPGEASRPELDPGLRWRRAGISGECRRLPNARCAREGVPRAYRVKESAIAKSSAKPTSPASMNANSRNSLAR